MPDSQTHHAEDTDEVGEEHEGSSSGHRQWRYSSAVEAARHLRTTGSR